MVFLLPSVCRLSQKKRHQFIMAIKYPSFSPSSIAVKRNGLIWSQGRESFHIILPRAINRGVLNVDPEALEKSRSKNKPVPRHDNLKQNVFRKFNDESRIP